MDVYVLKDIIARIRSDEMYLNDRRVFYENYEWLEHFWRYKYKNGNDSIDNFIEEKANFFWPNDDIKLFTKQLVSVECVGANNKENYIQTETIARATMYLRFYCDLFVGDSPSCDTIRCRYHKISCKLCTNENGRRWAKLNNDNHGAFKALMYILRQIRNNLFHGHKMTLDNDQFQRDKVLVSLAAETSLMLINNLVPSGG